jgi:hypothetical protein
MLRDWQRKNAGRNLRRDHEREPGSESVSAAWSTLFGVSSCTKAAELAEAVHDARPLTDPDFCPGGRSGGDFR